MERYFRTFALKLSSTGVFVATLCGTLGCKTVLSKNADVLGGKTQCVLLPFSRNWTQFPTVEHISGFRGTLYVMGDVHGHYSELLELLSRARVASGSADNPVWLSGHNILVFIGYLINKGNDSVATLHYVMNLQQAALRSGGRVIVTMGNHEVSFLADPMGSKTEKLQESASRAGLNLCRDIHSPNSPIGAWIRNESAAAVVNGILMSHTGYAYEALPTAWDQKFRPIVESIDWPKSSSNFACGKNKKGAEKQGFFNATVWWGKNGDTFRAQQAALGVTTFVFGHDPSAFHEKGKIAAYFGDPIGSALVKVDTGLGNDVSRGALLKCGTWSPNGSCAKFEVLANPSVPGQGGTLDFVPLNVVPNPPPDQEEGDPDRDC